MARSNADVRRRNLSLLLSGKGAKSALARVIGMSPATVTSMVKGEKPMSSEAWINVARAVGLPDDWFDARRTEEDVPAVARERLAGLPRGKAAVGARKAALGDVARGAGVRQRAARSVPPPAGSVALDGVPPIVEALIKTVVEKARKNLYTDDMAFACLDRVRSL